MKKLLLDFGYKRSIIHAIAFYVLWIFILLVLTFLAAILGFAVHLNESAFGEIGALVAAVGSSGLSILILKRKKRSNLLYKLLAGLSFIVGITQGALVSLVIPTFLTTLKPKS